MQGRLWVADAGADTLTVYDAQTLAVLAAATVPGAGALCAGGGTVFCAATKEDSIFCLHEETLAVTQRLPVAPGVCALRCAPDGRTLYALSGDGDSLLALDVATGALQTLARVGAQPRDLALDASGQVLAVAGGAACCVYILHSETLVPIAEIDVEGIAVGVALTPDALWVLCAVGQEELATRLLRVGRGNGRIERQLDMEGMPGGLLALAEGGVLIGLLDGVAYVAKHAKRVGWRLTLDGALPNSAARRGGQVFWGDGLSGCVWALDLAQAALRPCLTELSEPSAVLLR